MLEDLCELAEMLPTDKRLLFLLYYRHGYSTIEISELLDVHNATIGRRLRTITAELLRKYASPRRKQQPAEQRETVVTWGRP